MRKQRAPIPTRTGAENLRELLAQRGALPVPEALEIARRFSSADSVEFINGVLDAVRKTLQGES
ncbi:MAG: hypothetical protein IH916_11815 [Acidobacteria bacterium]|nr:hypothetical protein [Acidobacteriota bacterium]